MNYNPEDEMIQALNENNNILSPTMQNSTDEVLLSLQDLHVWFELRRFGFSHAGYVRAVDGVSFDLYRKEAIAIVGESGCGKSSLMKTILGINIPTKGDVIFEGRSLASLDRRELHEYRSLVGYVQQDPYGALPPFMSVQQIMEEPLIIHGVRNRTERLERIHRAFEEVKMTPVEEFLPKYPHMLSGGQQQRVVIARAMILNPVIYITHDLATVRYFSEYIFVMYAGEIIEKAKVEDLVWRSAHPYTHALLAATSDPDPKNVDEFQDVPPGEPPSLVNPPQGCRFHPRCSKMIPGECDVNKPPEFDLKNGHLVNCWLYK